MSDTSSDASQSSSAGRPVAFASRFKGTLAAFSALAAAGALTFVLASAVVETHAQDAAAPAAAADAPPAGFSADQKAGIEKIVRDYLIANPEILFEMQAAYEAKAQKAQDERNRAFIADNSKEIYRRDDAATAGNAAGDITVVEFFDYNCGYCKRSFPQMLKLIEGDKNLRVVFKEYPLNEANEVVSRIALATKAQGKYFEMHTALMNHKGASTEASALKVAEKLGLDMTKLKADMNSDAVKGELERVRDLAQKMGINGTPHFLVGDRSVAGAPENLGDTIKSHVADLRKAGCSYC